MLKILSQTLEKWGFGWKDMCKKFPKLIYASASGFGQTGPLKELPATIWLFKGMGGLMSVTGQPEPTKSWNVYWRYHSCIIYNNWN